MYICIFCHNIHNQEISPTWILSNDCEFSNLVFLISMMITKYSQKCKPRIFGLLLSLIKYYFSKGVRMSTESFVTNFLTYMFEWFFQLFQAFLIKRHFKQLKSTAYLKLFNWCKNYFCPYLYSNELAWKKYRSVDIHHFTAFELWYKNLKKRLGVLEECLELQEVVLSGCSSGSWLWLMTLIFPPIDINAIGSFWYFLFPTSWSL